MQLLLWLLLRLTLGSIARGNIQGNKEAMETLPPLKSSRRFVLTKQNRSSRRRHLKRKIARKTKASIKRLKAEMKEIGVQQKCIKEGQREVRKKFEEIESECNQLKKETKLIMQHNADTQFRLKLLFKILKAREDGDFATATDYTQSLRELILQQNKQKHAVNK